MQVRNQKIETKDRLFSLSSVRASLGYKLEDVVEVKIEPSVGQTQGMGRKYQFIYLVEER